MFYCNPCAEKRGWPQVMARSRGKCEECGKIEICNDHPSKDLPVAQFDMDSIEPGDHLKFDVSIERRPHGFDAALFAAFRGGVAAERISQTTERRRLTLVEISDRFNKWRREFGQ